MWQKLIFLGLFGFAVMFTRDAVSFPKKTDLSRPELTVFAIPSSYSKSSRTLIFKGVEGGFPVRCDLNRVICANPGQWDGKPVTLELIQTSWLNEYLVVALTKDGRRFSYVEEVSREIPRASRGAWVWPILFWLTVLFYGFKIHFKLK